MEDYKNLTPEQLEGLYKDNQQCAKLVGLTYSTLGRIGFSRKRHGKGFQYVDDSGKPITDKMTKKRLDDLVIPPAWQEVWISPEDNSHLLVTGIDEKGRKQYIYHPKWRKVRDVLKFYRLLTFGAALPKIRKAIDRDLATKGLNFNRVSAAMLWILDNTYIRIGNDIYFSQNDSVGLTTLSDHNAVIVGPVVTLSFTGKSGKEHTITFENQQIADIVKATKAIKGDRLFQYKGRDGTYHSVTAADINHYLRDISGLTVTAKDFRTWGGTLMAFNHLITSRDADKKPEKVAVEAVDAAADVLGNTRTIARSSYVHPHLLQAYTDEQFEKYYQKIKPSRTTGLDKRERELSEFLQMLFRKEFELLKS